MNHSPYKPEEFLRSILVVSSHVEALDTLRSVFAFGYRLNTASDLAGGIALLHTNRYDLVFIDIEILQLAIDEADPSLSMESFKSMNRSLEIVVMAPSRMIRQAVRFVNAGANYFLTYPFDPAELDLIAETIAKRVMKQSEIAYLRDQFWKTESIQSIRSENPVMKAIFAKIRSVAPTKTTVLLTGETGTGKGILAGLIHRHSNRRDNQFINLHCGAIPDTLLESELFGHEKGAFTGAVREKLGKFEIAKGGTIFLDEIGTITPSAQVKLLQVLQDGTFSRIGAEGTHHSDARVIAATNADLKAMCAEGSFRKDLYYRLNVFPIEIPPLRDRAEDLPFLIDVFLERLNNEMQKEIQGVHQQARLALKAYDWPGNIRELENLIERAYILETTHTLMPDSFPIELFHDHEATAVMPMDTHIPLAQARQIAIENFEQQFIGELLARNKGRIKLSAQEAGISTRQLHKLMTRYRIRKEAFKVCEYKKQKG